MSSKLREALENSNGLLEELALLGEWGESARAQIAENKAALSEPLRNCDVGTAKEQLERNDCIGDKYYLVVTEWLYPTESGHDVEPLTFDTRDEAIQECRTVCDTELVANYRDVCGDAMYPGLLRDKPSDEPKGYIILPKNGLDEWFFAAKIVEVSAERTR